MAQSPVRSLRLYGVAALDSRSGPSPADGTSAVHFRQITAVVEPGEYAKIAVNAEELQKYQRIIEEIFVHTPILPAPPGTVFKSEETLMRWMELHYFSLVEALSQVEGHSAARLALSVGESPKNDEAAKKFMTLASEALRQFRKNSAASVTHPPVEGEDGIVAKASFLVETDKWQEFAAAVTEEAKRHREFDFKMTGPWPPYDFVQMQFGG